MRKKNTTLKKTPATRSKKKPPLHPPFYPMTLDHEADTLKQILRNPKSDATSIDIITSALVDLSNELAVNYAEPDIAWVLYLAANDRYDAQKTPKPRVDRALSDIREILYNASQKRLRLIAKRREREDMPEEKELPKNDAVLQASYELLHNPKTPTRLWNVVAQFYTEQSSQCGDDLWHSMPHLRTVLNTVKPDEHIGKVEKASKGKKASHATN